MQNEYIIINRTAIQKRIEELEKLLNIISKANDSEFKRTATELFKGQIVELEKTLSQSTPLIPQIEKAFNSAREFNSLDGVVDIDVVVGFHSETKDLQGVYINSKDYISNLKLDI